MPWQSSLKKLGFFAPIIPKLILAQFAKAYLHVAMPSLLQRCLISQIKQIYWSPKETSTVITNFDIFNFILKLISPFSRLYFFA